MIEQLDDHFIICGYGRVGRRAAEEFAASGQPFVVLDTGEDAIDDRQASAACSTVEGSGSDDGDLDARRDRARARACSRRRTPTRRTSTSRSRRGRSAAT